MATVGDKIRQFYVEKNAIRSKVKFDGKYYKELESLMEALEELVEKDIVPNYPVEYTNYGNSNIKIKINDEINDIERLINCVLKYNKNDERYGYINLEFQITEFSKNKKIIEAGKFLIKDKEKLIKKFTSDLIPKITEIHLHN